MPILSVFETDVFFSSERLVCSIKRQKSFFHDLFSRSMTKGIHAVTGGYRGLQRVKRGYKGLQGVTRGYNG